MKAKRQRIVESSPTSYQEEIDYFPMKSVIFITRMRTILCAVS